MKTSKVVKMSMSYKDLLDSDEIEVLKEFFKVLKEARIPFRVVSCLYHNP
jgi:hypothetical protein